MATIFVPTYANIAMLYHDIKVFCIICLSYALARKHFENSRFGYLDDFQILLKVNLIKPDHLLSILKQINSNITLIKEKSETRSTFSKIMIKESGIYNKSTGLQYIFCIRNRSVIKLGWLVYVVMGNIFRKYFGWLGGLGPSSRPFSICQLKAASQ